MAGEKQNAVAALEATTHRVLDHLAGELADLRLSQGEINALAQLKPGVALTVAQIQAATGQRASTMTGVLDRLERRGLVERALNPDDRRSFTVTLTKPGAETAKRVRKTFADLERAIARSVSRRALAGYFEVLERLDQLAARG